MRNGEEPDPVANEEGAGQADPIVEIHQLTENYFAVLIDENAIGDPRELEAIGRPICDELIPCNVVLWFDREYMPTELPFGVDQLQAQVFGFGRTLDGSENLGWNCFAQPELEGELPCLPRPML